MIKDVSSSAAALYDGGWRAADRDQLIAEYNLTPDEADAICAELQRIEEQYDADGTVPVTADVLSEMIANWQTDAAPEYDDLEISDPRWDDERGEWTADAYDRERDRWYMLCAVQGNIVIC